MWGDRVHPPKGAPAPVDRGVQWPREAWGGGLLPVTTISRLPLTLGQIAEQRYPVDTLEVHGFPRHPNQ